MPSARTHMPRLLPEVLWVPPPSLHPRPSENDFLQMNSVQSIAEREKVMQSGANLTVRQIFKNGFSGFRQLSLRACGSFEELSSGTVCSSGTASPACVLDPSQGGTLCLVTLNDECFHSCKQDTLAKKLGLSEQQEDLIIGV